MKQPTADLAARHLNQVPSAVAPRWARHAVHVIALTTVPSGLWRLALAFGLPVGYSEAAARELFDVPGIGTLYVVGLVVFIEALALLAFGLVQPWGERVPGWVPFLGRRRVPVAAAVVPASFGAVGLTVLWGSVAIGWWFTGDDVTSDRAHAFIGLTYVPLAAWGPLLGAVTVSYYRRRRRASKVRSRTTASRWSLQRS